MFHSSIPTHPEATGIAELCQLGAALIADEFKGFIYSLGIAHLGIAWSSKAFKLFSDVWYIDVVPLSHYTISFSLTPLLCIL